MDWITFYRMELAVPLSSRLHRRQFTAGSVAALAAATVLRAAGNARQSGQSPFASPAAEEQSSGDHLLPLTDLLAMIPLDVISFPESSGFQWEFADLARQFASLGLHHTSAGPDFENEPFVHALYSLALTSSVFQAVLKEEFLEAIGFQPLGMNQTLTAGLAPNQVTLFRGDFDPDVLIAAWTASGYQQVTSLNGSTVWTIGTEGEFEVTNPVQQSVLSAMNNLAIVDDVLVCSPQLALMNEVLTLVVDGGKSALDDPDTGPIIPTLPEDMVSAAAVRADAFQDAEMPLQSEVESTLASIRSGVGDMPPITGLITAVGEGATALDSDWSPDGTPVAATRPDSGKAYFRLGTDSPEDAALAVKVVERRWAELRTLRTQEFYDEILRPTNMYVEGSVAAFDFVQVRSPNVWLQIVVSRDLLPLLPDEEQGD